MLNVVTFWPCALTLPQNKEIALDVTFENMARVTVFFEDYWTYSLINTKLNDIFVSDVVYHGIF